MYMYVYEGTYTQTEMHVHIRTQKHAKHKLTRKEKMSAEIMYKISTW